MNAKGVREHREISKCEGCSLKVHRCYSVHVTHEINQTCYSNYHAVMLREFEVSRPTRDFVQISSVHFQKSIRILPSSSEKQPFKTGRKNNMPISKRTLLLPYIVSSQAFPQNRKHISFTNPIMGHPLQLATPPVYGRGGSVDGVGRGGDRRVAGSNLNLDAPYIIIRTLGNSSLAVALRDVVAWCRVTRGSHFRI